MVPSVSPLHLPRCAELWTLDCYLTEPPQLWSGGTGSGSPSRISCSNTARSFLCSDSLGMPQTYWDKMDMGHSDRVGCLQLTSYQECFFRCSSVCLALSHGGTQLSS